jgi:DNA-binding MarR family transcriptional regulator
LQALFGKGLVERTRAEADRRVVRVRLSARGKQVVDKVFPRIAELNRELASALTPDELAMFAHCLSRLEARGRQLIGSDWASVKADRRHGGTRRRDMALP